MIDNILELFHERLELSKTDESVKLNFLPFKKHVEALGKFKKTLLITTSNRSEKAEDPVPKSTKLAYLTQEIIGVDKVTVIEIPKLNIYHCSGNVSNANGNTCGLKDALLKDKTKNPSGYHRCWVSWAKKDDELWKVTRPLFDSDAVVFYGSVRWGQMNGYYQKLIERLNWIENRHTTLGENNIVKNISAGIVALGHNWNVSKVIATQKQVFEFYGFKVPNSLSWYWQYTDNALDETQSGYKKDIKEFNQTILPKTNDNK